jgi:hypothetical protein
MPTYTIGTQNTGWNNRGANNPPYNYGTRFIVPANETWGVTGIQIQIAGNGSTQTVFGHIWNSGGTDYWEGNGIDIGSDTSPPFDPKFLTRSNDNPAQAGKYLTSGTWYVGFSKTASHSVNWNAETGTNDTDTGNTVNGNLSDNSPPSELARNLVGTITYDRYTAPGTPRNVVATPGNGSITVTFDAPLSNGGGISYYQYSLDNVNWSGAISSGHVITGLANGTAYTVYVRAGTIHGPGTAASATATPRTVPSAPSVTATGGIRAVTITFPEPGNGGSAITSYNYSLDNVNWSGAISSGFVITELANATAYTVYVRANNVAGTGASSAGATATTKALPTNPTSLTANASTFGVIGLSWTASSGDGYTVTYTVKRNGTTLGTTTSTTFNDTTVAPSTTYTYTVTASTDVGSSGDASVSATSLGGIARVWNGTNWTTQVALVKVCTNATPGSQVWTLAQARVWHDGQWKYGI